MNRSWTSWDYLVISKPRASYEQVMNKSWASHEEVMSKCWRSHGQEINKSWTSCKKMWTNRARVVNNYLLTSLLFLWLKLLFQVSGGWGWDGIRVGMGWFCNIWAIPYPLKCILQNRKTVKPHCNVKWLHQTEMQSRVQVDRGTRDLLQNESKLTEWNDKIIPSSATNVYITTCQCCWHDTVFLDLHILLKYIICSQTYKKSASSRTFLIQIWHFS